MLLYITEETPAVWVSDVLGVMDVVCEGIL